MTPMIAQKRFETDQCFSFSLLSFLLDGKLSSTGKHTHTLTPNSFWMYKVSQTNVPETKVGLIIFLSNNLSPL